jgi:hypothetical protein
VAELGKWSTDPKNFLRRLTAAKLAKKGQKFFFAALWRRNLPKKGKFFSSPPYGEETCQKGAKIFFVTHSTYADPSQQVQPSPATRILSSACTFQKCARTFLTSTHTFPTCATH